MTDPAVEDGGPRPMPPVRDTPPPPQAPPAPSPPPQPLGAHNDLTHPGGPRRPMPPVRDAAPAPGGKDDGSVGLGVLLAAAWMVASLVLTGATRLAYGSSPVLVLATQWARAVVTLGSLALIHVYAIRRRKPRVLVGFWGTIAVTILVFVVSCFALLAYTFGP